jgi:hypothetical protein
MEQVNIGGNAINLHLEVVKAKARGVTIKLTLLYNNTITATGYIAMDRIASTAKTSILMGNDQPL